MKDFIQKIIDFIMGLFNIKKDIKSPFKSTLFFPHSTRGTKDTWQFFSNGSDDQYKEECINFLHKLDSNSIIFLTSNQDGPVSLYKGLFGGEFDENKVNLWKKWAKRLNKEGFALFPTLFCDEDANQQIRGNRNEHERYIQKLVEIFDEYNPYWIFGLESSEWTSKFPGGEVAFVTMMRKYTKNKIGTHIQWNGQNVGHFDFIAYEHAWSPRDGNRYSAQEVLNIAINVKNKTGKPVFVSEYNYDTNGQKYKDQRNLLILNIGNFLGVG